VIGAIMGGHARAIRRLGRAQIENKGQMNEGRATRMENLIDLDAERQRKAQELEEKFARYKQKVEKSRIASEPITEAIAKLIDADFSLSEIRALLHRAAYEIDNLIS
jgi:hypothetical protein